MKMPARIKVRIDTDNAAFDGKNFGPELARIFHKLADNIDKPCLNDIDDILLFDINGNCVGDCFGSTRRRKSIV